MVTNFPVEQPSYVNEPVNVNYGTPQGTEMPLALVEDEDSDQSNTSIYLIGGILFFVIVGIVAFVIIRKRKQNNENTEISPANSMDSSNI